MRDDDGDAVGANASSARADRNLLFGIIALQNDFISREQLVAAFDAWVHDKSRGLPDILETQKALSSEDRGFLDRLVEKFLAKHKDNPEQCLVALSTISTARHELEQLNDPELGASLGHVGRGELADPRLAPTLPAPVGDDRLLHAAGTSSGSLGRFRILRAHAKGGLGQVSVALDRELNREVALKEIQPRHADNPVSRERFTLEAEITGGLEHPGIVPVYALGQDDHGRPFYAMRFVKGDSLKAAIEHFHNPNSPNQRDLGTRQLELRQLLGRFIDVCNAMEYAHSRGVLHRDLKPGNIMVGKYGETLVVDWGLAKVVGKREVVSDETSLRPSTALSSSGKTQAGAPIGTPSYMSPEQAAGRLDAISPASDVYSLGATLYHLLCGRPPYEKEDFGAILAKVQRGDYPKPSSVVAEMQRGLEAICLKAMSVKPVDRYQTASALANDLEHWLADEPISAVTDNFRDRLSRYGRKHRGVVRAGIVAVVLVAVVASAAALLIDEQRRAATKLAGEKSQLADSERKAKEEERIAKENAERQLRMTTAEQLVRLSLTKRAESLDVALLLAVESGLVMQRSGDDVMMSSHQSLLDALHIIGGRPLAGHQGPVLKTVISPNGRWLVTASDDHTARVWNLSSANPGASERVLSGHKSAIRNIAISPDSQWLITGSDDATVRIWNLSAGDLGKEPRVIAAHHAAITCMAIAPDGHLLVTGSRDADARIWDLTAEDPGARRRILTGHREAISSVAISPDNHWLVTGSDDATARVWDLTAEKPSANPHVLEGHGSGITSLAISTDSNLLVTGSIDKTARLWDLKSESIGANSRILEGHGSAITTVAISADLHWLVTGSMDKTARVWDLEAEDTAANPHILTGHQDGILRAAISLDSHWLATGSRDATARIWDLTANNPAARSRLLRGHKHFINDVAMSPDNRSLVTGSVDSTARIWDLRAENTSVNPRSLAGPVVGKRDRTAISADNHLLVTTEIRDKTVRVWDLITENPSAKPRNLVRQQGLVTSLTISPDNHWLVTGSDDGTVRVCDLTAEDLSAQEQVVRGKGSAIPSVHITPNSRWLVVVSDSTVLVWDLTAENPHANPRVLTGKDLPITCIAISQDSRWIATGDSEVRIWDLAAESPGANPRVLNVFTVDGLTLSHLAISPNNRWLVTVHDNQIARIWDLTAENSNADQTDFAGFDPRALRVPETHFITSMAISPDNHWLVTGSAVDRTACVWDLTATLPGVLRQVCTGHQGGITCLAISPDNHWLVTGSSDKTLRVWELTAQGSNANARVLNGHRDAIESVAFRPDNHGLITRSADGEICSWSWQWDDLVKLASQVGRNFSHKEWEQFFPRQTFRKTFPDLPVPVDRR